MSDKSKNSKKNDVKNKKNTNSGMANKKSMNAKPDYMQAEKAAKSIKPVDGAGHPKTRPVTLKFTNGDTLVVNMVYDRDTMILNSDMFNHRAWKKDAKAITLQSKAKKFEDKFGGKLVS